MKKRGVNLPAADIAKRAARRAGLHYACDTCAGIRRQPAKKGFVYLRPGNKPLRDARQLKRIRALAIPPAWRDVWICPSERGHLQATGIDSRGRKQYRYHERWRTVRDENKFVHLLDFGEALPRMRRAVRGHLALPGLPREKVLAAIVRLLDRTFLRIGNEHYARDNGHFGLTTVRNRHAVVQGGHVHFAFIGKSGKQRRIDLADPQLARVVQECQHLPGQHLFEYRGDDGKAVRVTSTAVNRYLRHLSGFEISAKDFRTWAGTVMAIEALRKLTPAGSPTQRKRQLMPVLQAVAQRLGNTVAVCRKCYIHPGVLEHFLAGTLEELCCRGNRRIGTRGLHGAEVAALCFLYNAMTGNPGNGCQTRRATVPGRAAARPGAVPKR